MSDDLRRGNTTLIVVVIVLILLALGGWYFFGRGRTSSTSTATNPTAQTSTAPTQAQAQSTFTDIIGLGKNQECDVKPPASGSKSPFSEGKMWTMGTKGRSTLTATVNGVAMEANAIYENKSVTTWIVTNGMKMGFKINQDEVAKSNTTMTAQQKQQAEQIRQNMIFNCHPWTPDPSKFVVPSDVKFTTR